MRKTQLIQLIKTILDENVVTGPYERGPEPISVDTTIQANWKGDFSAPLKSIQLDDDEIEEDNIPSELTPEAQFNKEEVVGVENPLAETEKFSIMNIKIKKDELEDLVLQEFFNYKKDSTVDSDRIYNAMKESLELIRKEVYPELKITEIKELNTMLSKWLSRKGK